jgi:hypothetical protein
MKNVLNQLGATPANTLGVTDQELSSLGMRPSQPAMVPNPSTTQQQQVQIDPMVNATAPNFSPSVRGAADYVYGSDIARGY